jgi:hypothetical protein
VPSSGIPFDHLNLAEIAESKRLGRKLREQPAKWTAEDRRRRNMLLAKRHPPLYESNEGVA